MSNPKFFAMLFGLLTFFCFPADALTLIQGQTRTFSFSSLPDPGFGIGQLIVTASPGALVTISLFGDELDAGEQLQLLAYENDVGEDPLYSNVFNAPTDQFGFHQVDPAAFWRDQQGVFTLTALLGSVDLLFVQAGNFDADRIFHSRTFVSDSLAVVETPLPAALPLFASGLGGMGVMGWWRRRRRPA
jgi:hypothetical protein